MKKKTEYPCEKIRFWKRGNSEKYLSSIIKKDDFPKQIRIMLSRNRYYEKDGNKPKFVGVVMEDSTGKLPLELDVIPDKFRIMEELIESLQSGLKEIDEEATFGEDNRGTGYETDSFYYILVKARDLLSEIDKTMEE